MQVIGGFFLSQKMSLSLQNLSVFESKEYSYLVKENAVQVYAPTSITSRPNLLENFFNFQI